jgi:hypothetical protein
MRNVKLFESFQEDFITEQIFSEFIEVHGSVLESLFLYEAVEEVVDWDNEEESKALSKGEKAALARGHQIMSEEQLAALYLAALGKSEEDVVKYISKIEGMLDFAETDPKTQKPKISLAALADAIGLNSNRTMSRTVNKFRNLIDGVGETESETIYPKLMKAYEKFMKMTPDVVANIAAETVQDPTNRVNRDAMEMAGSNSKEARKKAEKLSLERGEAVYTLFKALNARFKGREDAVQKAVKMAVEKIAGQYSMEPDKVKNAYEVYLKNKGILSNLNFK